MAALDQDFLLSPPMRGVRFLLEFAKVEEALATWGVRSTIVVFGSARVREAGPGEQPRWYAAAREFAALASRRGGAILTGGRPRDNVIATGGGPGVMEAANRGAADVGAPSIGFNIGLPHEQEPNAYSTPELTFRFHYFAMRKMHFAMRANALVVFPGGFGTFDELFEILTLRQTNKSPPIPVVLFDEAYWRSVINFDALVAAGMINAADLDIFGFAETAEEVWTRLIDCGLKVEAAAGPTTWNLRPADLRGQPHRHRHEPCPPTSAIRRGGPPLADVRAFDAVLEVEKATKPVYSLMQQVLTWPLERWRWRTGDPRGPGADRRRRLHRVLHVADGGLHTAHDLVVLALALELVAAGQVSGGGFDMADGFLARAALVAPIAGGEPAAGQGEGSDKRKAKAGHVGISMGRPRAWAGM